MKPTNQSFKLPKIRWKSAYLYIAAFLIPFLMLFTLHLLYNSGFGNPIVNILSKKQICLNGLAGICFLFYIRHTDGVHISDRGWQLVFSWAYGLCSYGFLQEGALSTLCLYAIFPIVFLSFEKMIDGLYYLPFLLTGALLLIIHPSVGLPVFFFLILLAFLEAGLKGRLSAGKVFHYLGCFALSFMLAAFRVFPYFESVYNGSYSYKGFGISCSPFVLLSRFLPGSAPSISFFGTNGIDLYFGLFFLLSFILFFFSKAIPGRKRLFYGCFTLLLIASLWLSPVRFFFSLFVEANGFSVPHSFFLVFWGLKLALEGIQSLKNIPALHIISGILFSACLLLVCYIGGAHNFNSRMLPVTLLLFLIEAAFLFFKKPKYLLFFLILLELGCNAFITTNLKFIPSGKSIMASFPWNKKEEEPNMEKAQPTKEETAYQEFVSSHKNSKMLEALSDLLNSVSLSDAEKKTYCGTAFPDQFQLFNGCFKKAGGKDDLFSPFPVTFHITDSGNYRAFKVANDIYHFSLKNPSSEQEAYYVPFSIQADSLPDNLYLYNTYTGTLLQLTSNQDTEVLSGSLYFPSPGNAQINFQLSTYTLDETLARQLPELTASYLEETSNSSRLYCFAYVGFAISCIGILILLSLYMNSDKEKIYRILLSIKDALERWKLPVLLNTHIKSNYIYYLSFLIPFLLFVASMILTDSVPFGGNSLFDEDGYALILPSALDTHYSMKEGNTYLSMTGGYGSSIYANNPLVQLSFYYRFLSPEQIAPSLLFMEALCLGLCGVAMVFYMTHRLHGMRCHKEDYRLLVPAMIYALNSYMLAMHNFTAWYVTLFAFPLLLTAMDYLIYKKKFVPYVLLLSFCIATNLYLGLYMCIFLVIYFFTCRFHGIKDFFKKGIRFGLSSLLGAGNCFFIIANTLQSSYDSFYREKDADFPSFGLHTSFLEQWKKHMIFSPAPSISSDNGLLNIYCGILTLLLILVYFFAKKVSAKEKLRKLLPILLLYISFNGQVLSYLWGGLHYQSKVPNRFVFLLLFLLAELSYEGLRLIRKISALKWGLLTGGIAGFFLLCQFLSSGNSTLPWICTLALCAVYLMIHLLVVRFQKQSFYPKLLVLFLIAELSANMLYISTTYKTIMITRLFDYPAIASALKEELKDDTGYCRTCFPARRFVNAGQIYNTGSNSLFNSYVSRHQCALSEFYGFSSGTTNYITSNYQGTPFGLSLSSHRYLFLPASATNILHDLERYEYLGYIPDFHIFENPDSLSLGIYAPLEAGSLDSIYLWQFYNDLASLYTDTKASLFIPQILKYSEKEEDSPNTFHFISGGKNISYEVAESIYLIQEELTSSFQIHLNYKPLIDGPSYLYADEFIPLGKTEANTVSVNEMPFSNKSNPLNKNYEVVTMNEEVFREFITTARKNQLENIQISNDTITGTTNYEKDGYTMLSLACDRSWHAYIDGKEVEIEDPYDSFMLIKTPAGKHTLELKYIPYGMKESKLVSLGFLLLTMLLLFVQRRKGKKA